LKKIIFKLDYGGLGDHLFYSALPRLLKEQEKVDQVYLSKQSNFRNAQIFDLIWKNNPYLDGVTDEEPTALPEIVSSKETKITNIIFEKFNILSEQEIPVEIYTQLEENPSLHDQYIDLNYISFIGAFSWLDKIMLYRKYPNHVMINPDKLATLLFPKRKKISNIPLVKYAQLINAATSFVTVSSGGATLAAALKKPSIVYFGFGQNKVFHHTMHNYIQVGGGHILRRRLARFLEKRNARLLKKSRNK
jgi:hypothetical protein